MLMMDPPRVIAQGGGLGGEKRPFEVEINHRVPLCLVDVDQGADILRVGTPGVVHPDIEVAIGLERASDQGGNVVGSGDVGRHIDRLGTQLPDLGHRFAQGLP